MAAVRWVIVVVAALIALFSILSYAGVRVGGNKAGSGGQLYYCPMHPSVVQDHPGECPICSMTLVPKPEGNVAPSRSMKPAVQPASGQSMAPAGGKYYCPMHPNRTSDDPNARCPDCGMKLEARPAAAQNGAGTAAGKYYCPMHPNRTSDDPSARCPDCGMKLEARPAARATPAMPPETPKPVPGLAGVDLTPERVQLIGMRTAVVRKESVGGDLRTVGVVAPSERGLAQITTRFTGWVEKLHVSATGERVRRGQVLASIYSPDVLRAEQELLVTRGWNDQRSAGGGSQDHEAMTGGLGESARQRLLLLGISAQEIEEILRSGKPTNDIAIRSPADGYVVAKNVVVGSTVQAGTVLFDVADLATVWVNADVYEQDLGRVTVGQPARFELPAFPGQAHSGRVQFISPVLDPQNRTLRVRLEFKNRFDKSGPRLRPGMYGSVYLSLPAKTGLMVPAEAVVDTGEMHYLFVAQEGGHFEPRQVQIGAHMGEKIEILSGVAEGETIVTTGNFLVDSESRLRAAIEGQTSAEAASGTDACSKQFDGQKYPDKVQACRACEIQHRGMGTMEEDCKNAIAKPWR
jgi:Cu(I)/Ag(I) efflux system membrane fusion protein